jgi:L-glutamine-phosphate cytidylyltransferase
MQAIILAAGVGSRLRDVHEGPKCLLRIGGKTILEHQIGMLRRVGVRDIVIVTGYQNERVEEVVKSEDVRFVQNERFRETNVLASWLVGSQFLTESHYYAHGDTIFEDAVLSCLENGSKSGVVLAVDRHSCGEEEMKVELSGKQVTAIGKELDCATAAGEFIGVMRVSKGLLGTLRDLASELLATEGNRLFFESAIAALLTKQPDVISWVDVTGLRWREIDFSEDLVAARAMFER